MSIKFKLRKKTCKLILSVLMKHDFFKKKKNSEIIIYVKKVEKSIYNFTISKTTKFLAYGDIEDQKLFIYKTKVRNLLWYLSDEVDNPSKELFIFLKSPNVDILKVAFLRPDQMNKSLYIKDKNDINKRLKAKITKVYNKLYNCPRCKEYKVLTINHQKRALDEAAGLQCICDSCGYRWNIC